MDVLTIVLYVILENNIRGYNFMTINIKFPEKGTMQYELLGKLLNGEVIRNMKAKDDLGTANPAVFISKLCNDKGWGDIITRERFADKSSNGHPTYFKKYYIKTNTILELMQEPRVQAFVKSYNKH